LLIACEEDFCRYKEGSKIMSNKFGAIQLMLEDMGYDSSIIEFRTLTPRANIDETKCIACGTCFFICPYNAIRMESSAKLDKEKCRGCGLCVSNCPAMAITLEGSDFDKISEEIENFAKESIKPKILVLGCQWSEYLSADENANLKKEVKFIRMPCSGRIDVLHILKALSNGIDGILLSICMDDICSFETGNKKTISNISKFIPVFETLNLKERVKLISVHPKYVGMFEEELNNFVQEIKELKPISLKGGEK
jgi:coenzyme F420-reducing hydrogenase delta subunit